ncbi:PREDICTED: LOW QUALITY PROTEIN: pannexin-2 [Myotis brandtii]|uniref:LOW QUALITY PROTEIN: pannexin-2 n=1 Tax=Myotis brandtii TaxID=109478 RepID=UPI0007044026|nr:PREDICTED: LOW QUALITY PROTEIN: pannexin-2 [Myotis brandtii]
MDPILDLDVGAQMRGLAGQKSSSIELGARGPEGRCCWQEPPVQEHLSSPAGGHSDSRTQRVGGSGGAWGREPSAQQRGTAQTQVQARSSPRLHPSTGSPLCEEPIYCYTPHNFTRDQALYARGYCWTELRDALPGVDASLWPSLFEHKLLPYSLLAFAAIMYVPALGWEFLASTRLTSELNFLLQEIDNCYHRAAEGRAPKIEKQIQSKGPGITEREKREIIENAEKDKSPEQNLFEKYLERRGRSNFLAKLYLARHLLILLLSVAPISYLCTYYATQKQNEKSGVDIVLLCAMNLIILVNLIHLFIFRKSNFIFDKLHKVGIKTRRQWRGSQFCDINILAMFCNENRDHIKSLNRLDFITNESDLMYDNVVRQLLAALAQSNHGIFFLKKQGVWPGPHRLWRLRERSTLPGRFGAMSPSSSGGVGRGRMVDRWACEVTCCVLRVADAPLAEEDILYPAEPARAALPSNPLLHISTLYEAREEEDGGPRAPPDMGSLIAIPPPQQILIATFDEPRTVVSTVEF